MIKNGLKSGKIVILIFLVLVLCFFNCSSGSISNDQSPYRVVDKFGQLSIEGIHVVNQQGEVVALEGMSMFWSQWIDKYYNYDCIKWLRDDWHCDVIRLPLGVKSKGYLQHPKKEMKKIVRAIDACIDLGLYVIVDWHSHNAEDEVEKAVQFFSEIAQRFGDEPNVLYEIYNEPLRVSWNDVVRPYHEEVIAAIRKYDPDNIILLGSPYWSQNVDEAAMNPVEDKNSAYTVHFYAATHKQWLRDKATVAIYKGLALWVTEFGTCESNGNGPIDYEELKLWFEFMDENKISWCNWSISDKKETSAALLPGADAKGGWSEAMLSESGKLIREKIRQMNP